MELCLFVYAVSIGGKMRTARFHFYDGTCLDQEIGEQVIENYGQWENPADDGLLSHSFKLRASEAVDPESVHYDEITWG
jgi:hypothetical protein